MVPKKGRHSPPSTSDSDQAPSPDLRREYSELVSSVELLSIQLVGFKADLHMENLPVEPNPDWEPILEPIEVETRGSLVPDVPAFYCGVKLGLSFGQEGEEPLVVQNAEYCIVYGIPEDLSVSEEAVSLFAERNAVFNVWPFWRELAMSTINRMGLPPIVVPLHRLSDNK